LKADASDLKQSEETGEANGPKPEKHASDNPATAKTVAEFLGRNCGNMSNGAGPLRNSRALIWGWLSRCSADLESAVSQNCILRAAQNSKLSSSFGRSADYKSAIQQIENLRYPK
jgi:hypothetical protein